MSNVKVVAVHRVGNQHGSLIVVIPILIRAALKLDPGDYIVFTLDRDTNIVEVSKFKTKGESDAGN